MKSSEANTLEIRLRRSPARFLSVIIASIGSLALFAVCPSISSAHSGHVHAGSTPSTHGGDSFRQLERIQRSLKSFQEDQLSNATKADIVCAPAASKRVQAIWMSNSGTDAPTAERLADYKLEIYKVGLMMQISSRETHPSIAYRPRFACDGDSEPDIAQVSVNIAFSTNSTDIFNAAKTELENQGHNNPDTKYLVYFDSGFSNISAAGQGDLLLDDSAATTNANNSGQMMAIQYGYSAYPPNWLVLAHELGHNMGAVQITAPHTTGITGLHCTDGSDVMCYADGGDNSSQYSSTICPSGLTFDCNHDDYFNANPESGSYLDTKWNIASANNRFVQAGINMSDYEPPTSPSSPVMTSNAPGSVTISWGASTDNVAVDSYVIKRTDINTSQQSTFTVDAAQTSYTDTSVELSKLYTYTVSAIDTSNNPSSAESLNGNVSTYFPPSTPTGLTAIDVDGSTVSLNWSASSSQYPGSSISYVVSRLASG